MTLSVSYTTVRFPDGWEYKLWFERPPSVGDHLEHGGAWWVISRIEWTPIEIHTPTLRTLYEVRVVVRKDA